MDRTEKKEFVNDLNDVFEKTSVVVVAHYSGLTVAQLQRCASRWAGWSEGAGRQEPAGQDCSRRHGRRFDRPADAGSDPDRLFGRSGRGAEGGGGFAKDFDKFVILGGAMGQTALKSKGSGRSRRFLRSTSCAPSSWASSRRPQPSWRSLRPPRLPSWRVSSKAYADRDAA